MEEDIGHALRAARQAQGISLRSLAADTGISASLLSQVETGKSQPSVSTLYALVNRLHVSLDELLGLEVNAPGRQTPQHRDSAPQAPQHPGVVIQRGADNPALDMDNGVRWERLASFDNGLVDALLVTYQGGASSSSEGTLMRHSGFEYAYLLEGSLTLALEFDEHELRAGDSFCFDSTRPHMYVNRGRQAARGLWYVIGRNSAEHTRERLADLVGEISASGDAKLSSVIDVFRRLDAAPQASGR
ncbi:helix-turn-helix domain-containing protein [Streptomyces sp. NPDC007107]|uniref:helix-turn-helix domain-containing protein n=1 Tax=Streptomyces sp. NPDC007107 TaxID=3156915 RepID=UPI0034076E3E